MGQPIDTASVAVVFDFSAGLRELKTDIESAMRQVAASVDRAFSTIERDAATASREVGSDFQRGGERAEAALREVAVTGKVAMASVARSADTASTAIGTRLAGAAAIAKTALIGLGVAAVAGLGALTFMGLKSAASLEQTQVAFDSLLGSAEEGKRVFDSLKEFAAVTPFELGEITPLAQKFLAFSGQVGLTKNDLEGFLTTVGDIASVTAGGAQALDSVGLAMSHIASGGKVSLEDINILSDALAGFSGVGAIAAAKGISTAEAMKQISAGEIDAKTGIDALLKGMQEFPGAAGAMEKQSQTLLGVFSTFKDVVGQALAGAFAPVIPAIKDSLLELTPILGEAVGGIAPVLGSLLASVLKLLGPLVKGLGAILMPILKALEPALDALGPALEPLGVAIGQVLEPLAPIIPLLVNFAVVLIELLIPFLLLLAVVLKPLTPILQFMADSVALVATELEKVDWAAVGHAIADAFVVAWEFLKGFFAFIGDSFAKFPGAVRDVFNLAKQFVLQKLTEIVEFVQSLLPGRLLKAVASYGSTLIQAGKDLIFGLWNGISSLGGWLWNKVKSFVSDNVLNPVKAFLHISSPSGLMATEVGEPIAAGIGVGISRGLPDLQALIGGIVPTGGDRSGAGVGAALGAASNIIVNVMFSGTVPTEAEAFRTGTAAGNGVADALMRRNIALAGRVA